MADSSVIRKKQSGFTLIELMIVVAIVAVLLVVGLPAWQEQVKRSKRTAAQAEMLDIANRQQQYLLSNRSYMGNSELTGSGFTLDPDVAKNYGWNITLGTGASPSYVLRFAPTPAGSQTSDGWLELNEQGVGTSEFPDKWQR